MKQYYTYLPSILFLIFNLGCGDSPGDNHSSNDNSKIAGDVSLDIATLLTDGSPKLDLNSLLSEELDPENNKSHCPTLDSSKLKNKINFDIPSWKDMLTELKNNKHILNYTSRL